MQALEQLHQLAQQYDQDPGSITSASQARLAETQAELARLVDQVWPWTKARIGFATAFLGAFAVAAAASYTFVIYLQKGEHSLSWCSKHARFVHSCCRPFSP